jgi:hypothetical protein
MDDGKHTIGRARNTFKRDYSVFLGGGMGAGGAVTPAGVKRYTFWVDHNPFATLIRRLITKNEDFTIYKTGTPVGGGFYIGDFGSEADLYVSFDQSNDRPDEMFTDPGELAAKRIVLVPGATLPPYFFVTTTIKQPVDPKFVTDQGNFVYPAYQSNGLGIAKTGTNDFIAQSYVPTSSLLTSLFIRDIFHVGASTDPTTYRDIIVELWDANRNFYANLGIIPKNFVLGSKPNNWVDVNGNKITTATDTWITATDALNYWIEIAEARCIPAQPIKVVPGATYYIVLRHTSPAASYLYGVGANTDSNGNYNNLGRYIYGAAFSGTGVAGSNSLTATPTNVSICFTTQRNVGRTAITFYWGNAGYLWNNPDLIAGRGQFRFEKEDFEQAEI